MSKELVKAPSEQALEQLRQEYPVEIGFDKISLPRISMASQDRTEGKGKATKVVTEAGTFMTEMQTEEVNDDGKKIWKKEELGSEIEAIVFFSRKQLRMYDEVSEKYTSSPIFDDADEIVPLFSERQEVTRGTTKELKAGYEFVAPDGKTKSKLEDNKILYILYRRPLTRKGEVFQLNLRGSSMYSFLKFSRSVLVPSVLVRMSSEAKEKGKIAWNQMTFDVVRTLDSKEVENVLEKVAEIKQSVQSEKAYYSTPKTEGEGDKDLEEF